MMRKEEKERHITVCMNKFKGKHPKITQGFVEKLGELLSRLLVWFIKPSPSHREGSYVKLRSAPIAAASPLKLQLIVNDIMAEL